MSSPAPSPQVNVPAGARKGLETCLRYHTNPPVSRILFSVLFVVFLAGFTAASFLLTRDVAVDASHDTGLLVVTKTYPVFGARRERFALASIQGTGLRSRVAKNGVLTYAMTLRTATGDAAFSMSYAPSGRQAQKHMLDAFLADSEAPPLHLDYDRGNPLGWVVCAFSLVMLWVLWTLWQEATVRFEWWRRAVVLERRRWPLPLWTRAFQLGEVAGARVEERLWQRRGGGKLRLVLTLVSGEEVPLLGVWGGGRAYHRELEASLNAELAKKA